MDVTLSCKLLLCLVFHQQNTIKFTIVNSNLSKSISCSNSQTESRFFCLSKNSVYLLVFYWNIYFSMHTFWGPNFLLSLLYRGHLTILQFRADKLLLNVRNQNADAALLFGCRSFDFWITYISSIFGFIWIMRFLFCFGLPKNDNWRYYKLFKNKKLNINWYSNIHMHQYTTIH